MAIKGYKEIDGKKCKEVVLGSGDKVYFLEEISGKRKMELRIMLGDLIDLDMSEAMQGGNPNMNFKMGDYIRMAYNCFSFLVAKIVTPDGSEKEPNNEYLESLSSDDEDIIYLELQSRVGDNQKGFAQKKS